MKIAGSPIGSPLSNHSGIPTSRMDANCWMQGSRNAHTRGPGWRLRSPPPYVSLCFALPQPRAFAQQLWYRVVLNRVDVVRLDLSDLPLHAQVITRGSQQAAENLDIAEKQAGFRPHLPPAGVLPGNPAISTIGLIAVQQTIHVREIEAALHKLGVNDAQVPPEWEGIQLRAEIGPMVEADYQNEVRILQARPFQLSTPSGFPLERFVEVAFRSVGVSLWEARALAQKFVANPAWLLDIPSDEVVNIQELSLQTGPALLIEDFDDQGKLERVAVIRSTSERIYAVMASSRQLAIKIAEALQ